LMLGQSCTHSNYLVLNSKGDIATVTHDLLHFPGKSLESIVGCLK
jgi:hypothetical protein